MNTAEKPLVSVLTATFNRAELLKRCAASLFAQRFTAFEWIVIDDGSTDHSFEVLNPYLLQYPQITYLKHRNRKQTASLNAALPLVKAPYLTFLDSDDEYLPAHLSLRHEYMHQRPDIDIIYGGLKIIGNPYVPDRERPGQVISVEDCVTGGTIFAKTEVFRALQGFKEMPYAADSELIDRARAGGYRVESVDFKTYVYYRDTPDSICNTMLKDGGAV